MVIQFDSTCSTRHSYQYTSYGKNLKKQNYSEPQRMHVTFQSNNKLIFFPESPIQNEEVEAELPQHKLKYLSNLRDYGGIR